MLLLTLVTWATAFVCARELARASGARSALVAAVLGFALLAVVPGELGSLVDSLRIGMALATVLFGVVAAALARFSFGPAASPSSWAPRLVLPRWPGLVLGTVGLVFAVDGAVTRNFFDDEHHVPLTMVIARGVIPPNQPLVPGQVIPYHWGVDAIYAQLVVAGLRADSAIDVLTVASWILFVLAAALAGAMLSSSPQVARRRAAWFASIIPFAGSALAWPLHEGLGLLQLKNPYPAAWTDWTKRPPPITADFFQHPQGLAFSLVLVILALWFVPDDGARDRRRLLAALLLSLLSLVEAIHFLVLGLALLVSTVHELWERYDAPISTVAQPKTAAFRSVAVLAAALVVATGYGGFLSPRGPTASTLLWGTDFFADPTALVKLLHHAVIFGLPFVFLPVAAFRGGAWRAGVVAGAAVSWFLPNVVIYGGSWDIVKLCSAGGFLASICFADTLDAFSSLPSSRRAMRAFIGATAALAAAFTIAFPFVWMASRTVLQGRLDVPKKNDWHLRDDYVAVCRAVTGSIPGRSRVLLGDPELSRQCGLLAPGFDPKRYANGHMLDFDAARKLQPARDTAMKTLDKAALATLDVDYALLSRAEAARLAGRLTPYQRVDVDLPNGYALYRLR